jgi:undecaprenyl-diphosphatase
MMAGLLHWVEAFGESPHAASALFVISFLESSFFPIPPDVLLIPLFLEEPELSFWFAGICSLGSIIGGMAGYGTGFWGGRPLLRRSFSESKIDAVHACNNRYNAWATGIAGLTPLPYKLFTFLAGPSRSTSGYSFWLLSSRAA